MHVCYCNGSYNTILLCNKQSTTLEQSAIWCMAGYLEVSASQVWGDCPLSRFRFYLWRGVYCLSSCFFIISFQLGSRYIDFDTGTHWCFLLRQTNAADPSKYPIMYFVAVAHHAFPKDLIWFLGGGGCPTPAVCSRPDLWPSTALLFIAPACSELIGDQKLLLIPILQCGT